MADFLPALQRVLGGETLGADAARGAMDALMEGRATDAQAGAFLAALKVRGETVDEIVGFARSLRARAVKVEPKSKPLLDVCGTGGDGSGTFNISTTVAFIAAGAGAAVAKHGNRSVSSKSGSADVLEALGVRMIMTPARVAKCVDVAGVGFLFAPRHHIAMLNVVGVRRSLGVRTAFNLVGPLVNPAGAKRQLVGVWSPSLVAPMARALKALGGEDALVVSSKDGLDELSLSAPTVFARLKGGRITTGELDPRRLGLKRRPLSALKGGDANANARITRDVLHGKEGAPREICLLNAAAALIVAGIARTWEEGLEKASESISSGRAAGSLRLLTRLSNG